MNAELVSQPRLLLSRWVVSSIVSGPARVVSSAESCSTGLLSRVTGATGGVISPLPSSCTGIVSNQMPKLFDLTKMKGLAVSQTLPRIESITRYISDLMASRLSDSSLRWSMVRSTIHRNLHPPSTPRRFIPLSIIILSLVVVLPLSPISAVGCTALLHCKTRSGRAW